MSTAVAMNPSPTGASNGVTPVAASEAPATALLAPDDLLAGVGVAFVSSRATSPEVMSPQALEGGRADVGEPTLTSCS